MFILSAAALRSWRNLGGGGGYQGHVPPLGKDLTFSAPPPPFKLSGTVTFLIIPRRWNTCSDGSVIPEYGKPSAP